MTLHNQLRTRGKVRASKTNARDYELISTFVACYLSNDGRYGDAWFILRACFIVLLCVVLSRVSCLFMLPAHRDIDDVILLQTGVKQVDMAATLEHLRDQRHNMVRTKVRNN